MHFGLRTITGIFYSGPYVWELASTRDDPAHMIKELHEGGFFDHIFYPGVSVSFAGNKFKITRWGIGNLPMSGNSFVHLFVGKLSRNGSKLIVRGRFRLNIFVLGFTLFWLSGALIISGLIVFRSASEYFSNGNSTNISGLLMGLAFPIFGTLMLLSFRRLAKSNESEILDGLTSKLGEPLVRPE